jgi:hypothetical protein
VKTVISKILTIAAGLALAIASIPVSIFAAAWICSLFRIDVNWGYLLGPISALGIFCVSAFVLAARKGRQQRGSKSRHGFEVIHRSQDD